MEAIALIGLRKLGTVQEQFPTINHPDSVLIEVKSIGICGSDMHYYKEGNIGSQVVQFPFVVGHEFAGVISEIGTNVTNFKVGDRVAVDPNIYCNSCDQCKAGRHHTCRNQTFMGCPGQMEGCNKKFVVMPARNCFLLPENLSFDEGMLIEPLSIGVYAAQQAGDLSNLDIAIWGYGPIGLCVHESVKLKAIKTVIVSEKLKHRCAIAKNHGANLVLNEEETIYESVSAFNPNLVDVAFECCGKQEALNEALQCLKPGGRLVIVGIPEFNFWQLSSDIIRRKEITIINIRRQNHCEQKAIDGLSNGSINLNDMITHRAPLSEAGALYELVSMYQDGVMKAVLYP